MNIFEELLSFKLTEALAKDKPKSTEKLESKTAKNLEMEPKQGEQPTKSTEKVTKAIPMPWYTNMDDYHNNNTNTPPTTSTTNVDKDNDSDGVKGKAPTKRGRQNNKEKSAPQAEEMLSPPPKKTAIESNKGMEQAEKRAIFQSPSVVPSFYNDYHTYGGYGFMQPHSYYDYGYPSWSPSPMSSAPPTSPMAAPMMLSPSPFQFQHHKFGWFGPPPIPVATSTPLMNPTFEWSTSSQQFDSSMMDAQKEASGQVSVSVTGEAGNEQSLVEEMWDTTAVGNTKMDLSNFCSWSSNFNSMEDQSNATNGPTSSGAISTAGPEVPLFMPNMPATQKQQFDTPHPMYYPSTFGHPIQSPYPPYSTGHLPMPINQQIIKDIKHEKSEDAKDDIWRNCLVCGENNYACRKNSGLQVCVSCKIFFRRIVESGNDKTATFECSKGSGNCLISKETGTRKLCKFCRFHACLKAGMHRQKVFELKAKRGPEKNGSSSKDN